MPVTREVRTRPSPALPRRQLSLAFPHVCPGRSHWDGRVVWGSVRSGAPPAAELDSPERPAGQADTAIYDRSGDDRTHGPSSRSLKYEGDSKVATTTRGRSHAGDQQLGACVVGSKATKAAQASTPMWAVLLKMCGRCLGDEGTDLHSLTRHTDTVSRVSAAVQERQRPPRRKELGGRWSQLKRV